MRQVTWQHSNLKQKQQNINKQQTAFLYKFDLRINLYWVKNYYIKSVNRINLNMQKQNQAINGRPIEQVKVLSSFSGKKKYIWENSHGSVIQLDPEQVQEYESMFNQNNRKTNFEEERMPAFTKAPPNLTKWQKAIENKIQNGIEKQSFITQSSQIQQSMIYEGLDCQFCKQQEPIIQNLQGKNKELNKQLEHLKQKISRYQQQRQQFQKVIQNISAENKTLKAQIRNQHQSPSSKPFSRYSAGNEKEKKEEREYQREEETEKSNILKLSLLQNSPNPSAISSYQEELDVSQDLIKIVYK